MPTPIVVVDQFGTIVYGNACMETMMRISLGEAQGRNIMEFIHPDDMGWAVDAFVALSEAGHDSRTAHEPWAALPIKAVGDHGEPIHVEITGANVLTDDLIEGFVYEVRHGGEHHLLRQVLTGLASDRPVDELIQLVAAMIAAPPVRLQVAIAEVVGGRTRIVGATGADVARVLGTFDLDDAPWIDAGDTPSQIEVCMLPELYRSALDGRRLRRLDARRGAARPCRRVVPGGRARALPPRAGDRRAAPSGSGHRGDQGHPDPGRERRAPRPACTPRRARPTCRTGAG